MFLVRKASPFFNRIEHYKAVNSDNAPALSAHQQWIDLSFYHRAGAYASQQRNSTHRKSERSTVTARQIAIAAEDSKLRDFFNHLQRRFHAYRCEPNAEAFFELSHDAADTQQHRWSYLGIVAIAHNDFSQPAFHPPYEHAINFRSRKPALSITAQFVNCRRQLFLLNV